MFSRSTKCYSQTPKNHAAIRNIQASTMTFCQKKTTSMHSEKSRPRLRNSCLNKKNLAKLLKNTPKTSKYLLDQKKTAWPDGHSYVRPVLAWKELLNGFTRRTTTLVIHGYSATGGGFYKYPKPILSFLCNKDLFEFLLL